MMTNPYTVIVSNNSDNDYQNVRMLGANSPSALPAGVSLSTSFPGVSYGSLAEQSKVEPFFVDATYFQVSTLPGGGGGGTYYGASGLMDMGPIIIETRDANGRQKSFPVYANVSPYQRQSDVSISGADYIIDGKTSMVIPNLKARTQIKIFMYPKKQKKLSATGKEQMSYCDQYYYYGGRN